MLHALNLIKRDYGTAYNAASAKSRFDTVAKALAKKSQSVASMLRATEAARDNDVEMTPEVDAVKKHMQDIQTYGIQDGHVEGLRTGGWTYAQAVERAS